MIMPSIGHERDKLIATLKGIKSGRCYSTDLVDSWLLWNELWESHETLNYQRYTGMTGKEVHEIIAEVKVNENVHMAYGDSFSDAVSQVWLRWKRDEK